MSSDFERIIKEMADRDREDGERARANLKKWLVVAREAGLTRAVVTFDGSGDSGSIDYIEFFNGDEPVEDTGLVAIESRGQAQFDGKKWVYPIDDTYMSLEKALDEIAYGLIAETGIDWYNNEGGFGTLVIDVGAGEFDLEVNRRFEEYETLHNSEGEEI